MSTIFDAIFKADTKELDKASDSVEKLAGRVPGLQGKISSLQGTFKDASAVFTSASTSLAAMTVAAAGATVALGGLGIAMAMKYTDIIDDLGDLGAMYGYTAGEILAMKNAAEGTGGSLEGVMATYAKVANNIAGVGGEVKKSQEALKVLGVTSTDVDGKLKATDQVTMELIKSWKEGAKTTEDFAAMEALLGKKFQENIPAIEATYQAQQYANEMAQKGIFISQESVDAAGDNVAANNKLNYIMTVMGSQLVEMVIPAFTQLKEWLVKSYEAGGLVSAGFNILKGATWIMMGVIKSAISIFIGLDFVVTSAAKGIGALLAILANPRQAGNIWKEYKKDIAELSKAADEALRKTWATTDRTQQEPQSKAGNAGGNAGGGEDRKNNALKERMKLLMDLARIQNKEFDDEFNAQQKLIDQAEKAAGSLREKIEQMQFENSMYGKTTEEVIALTAARELERAGIDSSTASAQELIAQLKEEARVREANKQNDKDNDIARKWKDSIDPLQKYRDQLVEIDRLQQLGKLSALEAAEANMNVNVAMEEAAFKTKEVADSQKTMWEQLQDAIEGYTQKMGDAFVDFAMGAKTSFGSLVSDILQQLARMVANEAFKKMFDMFKGGMGGGSSGGGFFQSIGSWIGSFFKNGAAFDGGGIAKFAAGDVFDSPTRISYGGGKQGEIGEAGPEAVMPLTRMSNGKLGVQASGQGGSTTINNISITVSGGNNPDETAEKTRQATLKAMQQVADSRIANSRRSGGILQPVGATAF